METVHRDLRVVLYVGYFERYSLSICQSESYFEDNVWRETKRIVHFQHMFNTLDHILLPNNEQWVFEVSC
jgi:hypothetical protein